MIKRPHWTQTAQGKIKLSEQSKKWHAEKREAKLNTKLEAKFRNGDGDEKRTRAPVLGRVPEHVEAYALGHITAWLEVYARSHNVPASILAYRVGKGLQRS